MKFFNKITSEKSKIILFILCVLTVVSIYLGFRYVITVRTESMLEGLSYDSAHGEEKIVVHVKGAVKNPGLYELPRAGRVKDAVDAAGGFSEYADADGINLAAFLEDGSEIIIPSVSEGQEDTKININTADKQRLSQLDGIGESLAERIIEHREQNGLFLNIDQIKEVEGISESKFSKIKDKIKVG